MSTVTANGHRKRKRGLGALIPSLAEGSHQGNSKGYSLTFTCPVVEPDPLRAELDLATTLLRQLVGALTRQGSYMPPEDQDALRAARAFLVDRAK